MKEIQLSGESWQGDGEEEHSGEEHSVEASGQNLSML
jgi:hypothetical protein